MDTPVVDFHNHVGRWGVVGGRGDITEYVRIMDAAGVDRACINSIFFGDHRICNDRVARFVSEYPDRFIGVAFVTPHYPEEAVQELERAFDVLRMRYLKLYAPYFYRPIDHDAYMPIFEWANDRGIVVMSHCSFGLEGDDTLTAPWRFDGLAKRFPQVKWVLAHAGFSPVGEVHAIQVAREHPNIFLETATSRDAHGTIEHLVDGVGADRVLYGSDMPIFDARQQLGRIVTAQISEDAKRKILGLNAIKLLGLES